MSNRQENNIEDSTIIRLDIIINLLSRLCLEKKVTVNIQEQIDILNSMKLSSGDIGRIIGKDTNYVTANISRLRRRGQHGRKNRTKT